jgi:hypothetical protein
MRLIVDIDDVLYPWCLLAHETCERAGVTKGVSVMDSWHAYVEYGITVEEWYDALSADTLSGVLYAGEPMPGVIESLRNLQGEGHTIHLATARGWLPHGNIIKAHTANWLHEWGLPYDSLSFTRDKTILAGDVWVDDSPTNYNAVWNRADVCYLVSQPWNMTVDAGIFRVEDFNHFARTILEMNQP